LQAAPIAFMREKQNQGINKGHSYMYTIKFIIIPMQFAETFLRGLATKIILPPLMIGFDFENKYINI
jgi:hypothetical protein